MSLVSLGDALALIIDNRGKTPKKLGGDWTPAGHRVVSALNIKASAVDGNDHHYIDGEMYAKWMPEPLKAGDVILTSEAPLGEVAYISRDVDWAVGQRLFALRADPAILDGRFLFYLLRGGAARHDMLSRATGTTVMGIRQAELVKVRLALPPLEAQREAAATLGALDNKIASNNAAVRLAEALADQLFGRSALLSVPLSEVATITMGSSPPGHTYNTVGEGLPFYQGTRDFGKRYPGHRQWTTGPVRLAQENDTLLSVRAPVGDLNRARENCCIGRGVAAIHGRMPSSTFYALRAAESSWAPFEQEGTVFGSISRSDLSNVTIRWPSLELLATLENQLVAIDNKIKSLVEECERLVNLRDYILPELVSDRTGRQMETL